MCLVYRPDSNTPLLRRPVRARRVCWYTSGSGVISTKHEDCAVRWGLGSRPFFQSSGRGPARLVPQDTKRF